VHPNPRFPQQLLDRGVPPEQLQMGGDAARQIIQEAVEFARQFPLPSRGTVYEGTLAEG
jgi:TPP-dependent pyruvate/acetoin dehydrogenase alpha subunit